MKIRTLRADEIECRAAKVKEDGAYLLLYKDARCDMRILDEVFGIFGWQRHHETINGKEFCTVSIKDEQGEWISKQDCGTETNAEKEKGQSSDAFKRACFNWGIGRELYTAPFIKVPKNKAKIVSKNGKLYLNSDFFVEYIQYNDKKEITSLIIADKDTHNQVFFWKKDEENPSMEQKKNNKYSNNGDTPNIEQEKVNDVICPICEEEIKPIKMVRDKYCSQRRY